MAFPPRLLTAGSEQANRLPALLVKCVGDIMRRTLTFHLAIRCQDIVHN